MMQILIEQIFSMGFVFIMGLSVALSPCLFPLLPLFLIKNLQGEDSRRRSLLVTGVLVAGIIVSFAIYSILSILVWTFAYAILVNSRTLVFISYIVVIIIGIIVGSHTIRDKIGLSKISMRTTPGNPKGLLGVFGIGATYTLVAIPCTGALIASAVGFIAFQPDLLISLMLYIVLCIGIAVPYLSIAIVTGELRMKVADWLVGSQRKLEMFVGFLLVCIGVYLIIIDFYLPYL